MKYYGDITKLSGFELPPVDVITGGSPCQDLSIAGNRAGLEGERSGLFIEQIRIVKEMRERDRRSDGYYRLYPRPRYMVWENVKGSFSSNNGADFQKVLTEIVRIAEPNAPDVPMPDARCGGRWSKSGCLYDEMGRWSVAWRLHDAKFWGVPQRRERISVIADFGGLSAPEILFVRKGLSWDPPQSGEARKETPETTGDCLEEAISFQERAAVNNQSVFVPVVFDARGNGDGKTVPTLVGDHGNRVTDYTALCIGNGQLNQISMSEQSNTLDAMHDQQAIYVGGAVRRLTPLEYERLQGYPDGYTDIGEWVDSKGKLHKSSSDTARYKSLGNSIAIPFWFYLLRRIAAQYERPATLGSLFDGISGFCLAWEKCNGEGTALWSSEIEEFPIAVTKRHFRQEES